MSNALLLCVQYHLDVVPGAFIMGCVLECSTEEAIGLGAAIMMQVDWD